MPVVIGDKKIVWELNRHQYFTTLGQAYWLTGDERYAQPLSSSSSPGWTRTRQSSASTGPVVWKLGLRAISWLWAFHFFKDSAALTPQVFSRALKFLYLHARHLETYLSTYFSPNTHLTGEALALILSRHIAAGVSCRSALAQNRQAHSARSSSPVTCRPDGVYFEQSSYYHRYTTDFYTHFLILSRANGEMLPARSRAEAEAAARSSDVHHAARWHDAIFWRRRWRHDW